MRRAAFWLAAALLARLPAHAQGVSGEAAFLGQARAAWERLSETRLSDAGFHPPERVPRFVDTRGLADAVVRLRDPKIKLNCSGVFISRTGYILTAAHCIEKHLVPAKTYANSDQTLWLTMHERSATEYGGARLTVQAGPAKTPVSLVVAGKGLVQAETLFAWADLAGWTEKDLDIVRRLQAGDWAILKAETAAPTPCARAGAEPPPAGAPLLLMGYPADAERKGAPGARAGKLYATIGKKSGDIHEHFIFQHDDWRLPPGTLSAQVKTYQPNIAAGNLIFSNNDAQKGMSGGPLFDDRKRLVAVANTAMSDGNAYRADSTVSVSVTKIFSDLRESGLDPARYFACSP
ncbi:MAG: serine protease [Elusimicrobia bacterium]|nr:serine protease [Elusimicrobiota bacterium]